MTEFATLVAVLSNLGIALAYLGIGLYVTPKFSLAGPSAGSRLAKLAGLGFFVTCGMTHLELAAHASQEVTAIATDAQAEWLVSWHGLLIHGVQAVAGLAFLALASRYLQVRIYNKQYYERVLDDRISDIERQIQQET